jgi:hypothetical protein
MTMGLTGHQYVSSEVPQLDMKTRRLASSLDELIIFKKYHKSTLIVYSHRALCTVFVARNTYSPSSSRIRSRRCYWQSSMHPGYDLYKSWLILLRDDAMPNKEINHYNR